jgi:NADP-dependent 3-hydroxy acid dehydrogenase YdfG
VKQGRIVWISSIAGCLTQPKEGAYAASKHAVEAFADALRQELMYHQVSVSLIEPGFVGTPILSKVTNCNGAAISYNSERCSAPRIRMSVF